jgi:hypothetical protein
LWVNSFEVLGRLQECQYRTCEEEFIDRGASFSVLAREVPIHGAIFVSSQQGR